MVTLEQTLQETHDWAIDRIHTLCEIPITTMDDAVVNTENAYAISAEFKEWLDPNIDDHDVYSLEFIGDEDGDHVNEFQA